MIILRVNDETQLNMYIKAVQSRHGHVFQAEAHVQVAVCTKHKPYLPTSIHMRLAHITLRAPYRVWTVCSCSSPE